MCRENPPGHLCDLIVEKKHAFFENMGTMVIYIVELSKSALNEKVNELFVLNSIKCPYS